MSNALTMASSGTFSKHIWKKFSENPSVGLGASTVVLALWVSALEVVQIEGAEVLPEVMQTLEQLDLTMAQIDVATVSLEPAPSGVPAINTKLTSASGSITSTLDNL